MGTIPLKDVAPGTLVVTQETIGDSKGNIEIRNVFYRRLDGDARYPHNVRVERLGIAQGEPGYYPRYKAWSPYVNEADGRIHVLTDLDEAEFAGSML